MSSQKEQEKKAGRAFIEKYNRCKNTDYEIDESYNGKFPDLRFVSQSEGYPDLNVEVTRIVHSEQGKAEEAKVNQTQGSVGRVLKKMGHKGVFVGIRYTSLPNKSEPLVRSISKYVDDKVKDLRDNKFRFSRTDDVRSFWELGHITASLESITVSLIASNSVSVCLLGNPQKIFPEKYIRAAICKKVKRYSPGAVRDQILLLDCDCPWIEEGDMESFAVTVSKIGLGFSQVWCVNILADRTIVKQLA